MQESDLLKGAGILQEAVDVINAGYMGDNAPGHRTLAEEIRAEIAQGLDRTRRSMTTN